MNPVSYNFKSDSKKSPEMIQKTLTTKIERYGSTAFKHSEETKNKIRNAIKGTTHTKNQTELIANKIRKKILQCDLNGDEIKIWNGIRKCANTLKINHSGIVRCLNGSQKKYANFIWKYID